MSIDIKIDEFIAKSRKLNGKEISERAPWNNVVTADASRHFAHGISDDNSLQIDPEYAKKSITIR